jgi:hypothetical protein
MTRINNGPKYIPNGQNIFQMAKIYSKWAKYIPHGQNINIPNGHIIYPPFPSKDLQKRASSVPLGGCPYVVKNV